MIPSANRPTKVISLLGLPRSGTTIAAEFLGAQSDYFNVGEFQSFVTRSIVKQGKCQCGQTVFACDFWSRVLRQVSDQDLRSLMWLRKNLFITQLKLSLRAQSSAVEEALMALSRLYALVSDASGERIIVDTSKNPLWHAVLRHAFGENSCLILWNRRCESIIGSFESRRQSYQGRYFFLYLILRRVLFQSRNIGLKQGYDQFVERPGYFLKQVDSLMYCNEEAAKLKRDYTVRSFKRVTGHSIAGNPSRLATGDIKIAHVPGNPKLSGYGRLAAGILNYFQ